MSPPSPNVHDDKVPPGTGNNGQSPIAILHSWMRRGARLRIEGRANDTLWLLVPHAIPKNVPPLLHHGWVRFRAHDEAGADAYLLPNAL